MPVRIETGRAWQNPRQSSHAYPVVHKQTATPRPRTRLIPILLRGPKSASRSWPGSEQLQLEGEGL